MKKLVHISGTILLGGGPEYLHQLIKYMDLQKWEAVVCTRNDGPYWDKFRFYHVTSLQ